MNEHRDQVQQLAQAVHRLRVLALDVAQLAEALDTLARSTRERAILSSEHAKKGSKDGR